MIKRFAASAAIFAAGFALCAVTYGGNAASLANGLPNQTAPQAQKATQTQIVWEYTWTNNAGEINKLGAQGWELAGISDFVTTNGGYISSTSYFYFKRAK
jgi:hypothetical protein